MEEMAEVGEEGEAEMVEDEVLVDGEEGGIEEEDLEGLLVDTGYVLLQLAGRHGALVDLLLLLASMLNIEQAGNVLELRVHVLVGVDRRHFAVAASGKAG